MLNNNTSLDELNENITTLTLAIRELTNAIKTMTAHEPQKAQKIVKEEDMCKLMDFVNQVYSELYSFEAMKEGLIKRGILTTEGDVNPFHPDCIFWMIKDNEIYGDPETINNLILDMLAE